MELGASKLIIVVRSLEKGEAAKKYIEESTKCDSRTVEVWPLDLCSYASVKAFAARASTDLERIDVLLANAAVKMLNGPGPKITSCRCPARNLIDYNRIV